MTSLFQLSELTRSLFLLWTLTLCLIGIFSIVRSVALKRFRFAAFALLPFGCSYFLWQVMFDIHLFGDTGAAAAVSRKLGAFPWIGLLLALLVIQTASHHLNRNAVGSGREVPYAAEHLFTYCP